MDKKLFCALTGVGNGNLAKRRDWHDALHAELTEFVGFVG